MNVSWYVSIPSKFTNNRQTKVGCLGEIYHFTLKNIFALPIAIIPLSTTATIMLEVFRET